MVDQIQSGFGLCKCLLGEFESFQIIGQAAVKIIEKIINGGEHTEQFLHITVIGSYPLKTTDRSPYTLTGALLTVIAGQIMRCPDRLDDFSCICKFSVCLLELLILTGDQVG